MKNYKIIIISIDKQNKMTRNYKFRQDLQIYLYNNKKKQ